jgi:NAD(P)-dependent dehydrogenase (short-subunit alcohol dehydrogenase family)
VHLKGTFAPTRHAAAYWREQAKAGATVDARIINTTSPSGLFGNLGQANYGAAKAGIATLTIIAAGELARYGVTVNAIAPTALTRMTEDLPVMNELAKQGEGGFNSLAPENIAPLGVWLGSAESGEVTGRVFSVWGGRITVNEGWAGGPHIDRDRAWTPAELGTAIPEIVRAAAPNADMSGARPVPAV